MKRVIVVGSGAGGATVARELAAAGDMRVTVVEAGRPFRPFGGDLERLARLRASRLFVDPRLISTLFPAMRVTMVADRMALVRGIATGGTTTLATGNALRADEDLRRAGLHLDQEFALLEAELPISTDHERRWRPATRSLRAAFEKTGLETTVTPKLVDYGRCRQCGRCVLGCPHGAKWDACRMLDDAIARGATLLTAARVERLAADGGQSRIAPGGDCAGVIIRRRGRRELLPADLVILAAGGLGTPAILARSGVPTKNRLWVDPVLCVAAPWPDARQNEEIPMPFFSRREGYMLSPYFDQLSFFFDGRWRRPADSILSVMIKLADSEAGDVDGRRVRKALSARDNARLAEAVELCREILVAAGADSGRVFLGSLNAGHPGGMVPLDASSSETLHHPSLPRNVYVADASLLPSSLGLPPTLTIMALAVRVAAVCRRDLNV